MHVLFVTQLLSADLCLFALFNGCLTEVYRLEKIEPFYLREEKLKLLYFVTVVVVLLMKQYSSDRVH